MNDPDFPGKFLYVWVDAPIGYLSSAEHYFAAEAPAGGRLAPADFEARYLAQGAPARLEHFIGKDILRFHAVFWPAMLWAAGLKTPDRMAVHGHLTVNGEKMSKSRGTFITAQTYLDAGLDPELLRYFYAANLRPGDLRPRPLLEEFRNRINADLANTSRTSPRAPARCSVGEGSEPLERPPVELGVDLRGATGRAPPRRAAAFLSLEYRSAVRRANEVAEPVQPALQEAKPWEAPAPRRRARCSSTWQGAARAGGRARDR